MKSARLNLILFGFVFTSAVSFTQAATAQTSAVGTTAGRLTLSTNSPAAKEEFWRGMEDWQTGAYTSGMRHFRRASTLDSGFALARLFSMGEVAAREQAADRDRAVADAARQSTEEGLLALFWREKALGHLAQVKVLLRAAMQLMPNEPAPAVEYSWLSTGDGTDVKQALDSARAFVARYPSYAPLAFPVVYLTMISGDTAGALRAAEEFTRSAPGASASYGYYGGLLQQSGRYEDAAAQFRKGMAVTTHADYGWDPASALAEMYGLRGRYADARAVATEALARATDAGDSATHLAEMAATWYATGDNARGKQLLEQARQTNATVGGGQNPVPVDYLLAQAGAFNGDLTSTRTYLARLHPRAANDSAIFFANSAVDYAYAGQLDSSMAYSDRLEKVSAVPWAATLTHHTRGLALAVARQCSRARTELAQAPDSASFEVLLTRADCEFQLGNRAAGLALRDRAIASQEFVLFDPAYVRQRVRLAQMK
jgi:tetratricopeptide (TPR) repeat protein